MDIENLIKSGGGMLLVVSPIDLQHFGDTLIEKAQKAKEEEMEQAPATEQKEQFLTTKEVLELFGVCETTLYSWHKNGLLRHRKFGKRNMYAMSDIKRFMNDHVDTETVSGYAQWHDKVKKLPT